MLITHGAQYISIFKPQVGGKAQRRHMRERAGDDGLMTESERALHSFWQKKAQKLLDGVKITFHPGFQKQWYQLSFLLDSLDDKLMQWCSATLAMITLESRDVWGMHMETASKRVSNLPQGYAVSPSLLRIHLHFWLTWFSKILLYSCCPVVLESNILKPKNTAVSAIVGCLATFKLNILQKAWDVIKASSMCCTSDCLQREQFKRRC